MGKKLKHTVGVVLREGSTKMKIDSTRNIDTDKMIKTNSDGILLLFYLCGTGFIWHPTLILITDFWFETNGLRHCATVELPKKFPQGDRSTLLRSIFY